MNELLRVIAILIKYKPDGYAHSSTKGCICLQGVPLDQMTPEDIKVLDDLNWEFVPKWNEWEGL